MPGKKKCDPNSGKFEICVDAGEECNDFTKDSCEGDKLVYCMDGYATRTDCTELGFSGCKEEPLGSTTIAVCK